MRILIVIPQQHEATGNFSTAHRYAAGLRRHGHTVEIVAIELDDVDTLRQSAIAFRPDLIHLLHAWRTGKSWLQLRDELPLPYLVTLTGTDVNHDIDTPERGLTCLNILEKANYIITHNHLTAKKLSGRFPDWHARIRSLPQGVVLGNDPYPLRRLHNISEEAILFLHPAGIRPVKRNLELLRLFAAVAAQRPKALVAFCGPELDRVYSECFHTALCNAPYARYLGVIPPQAMAAAMREADVILNHSVSEGLPHALQEATVVGIPILARNIEGNRAVVDPDENGLLYRDDDDFPAAALRLIDDKQLRQHYRVPRHDLYRPEDEISALIRLLP